MDMQPLQATFATQEQAETAIRKLASLRSDQFRLERVSTNSGLATESSFVNALDFGLTSGIANGASLRSLGSSEGVISSISLDQAPFNAFELTAQVPKEAIGMAQTVISQAGGQLH
ncbi:MAG: hypothetical protein P0Y55_10745 [Candidatus Cohnella colombiensis]|uniref:Uncharacterized protein n=1 Tax=Candidatus Cohnella colombiensis TaxID=3121368 RepID=A0AA95EUC0_9BACL|nr:MAG: hypothetical protein P0Y55_10745 [Cohnella sp.]